MSSVAAWTADDVVHEYGEAFLRDLVAELQPTQHSIPLDWAEPGDPPLTKLAPAGQPPIASHLRANPLPRKKWPTHLKPWHEELLVLWWRTDLSENALNALVEAHRPMVASTAQKYVGTNRKLLIEYGMLGLRLAATRQWASGRRKGAQAGFDQTKGYRFSTYARHQAERMMREAARRELRPPQHLQDTKTEFAAWAATPIPFEIARDRADYPDEATPEPAYGTTDWSGFERPWYIHAPNFTKAEKRKGRPTETEQNNRREFYAKHGYVLDAFDKVARDGLGGWSNIDGGDDCGPEAFEFAQSFLGVPNGEDYWEPCSGAFKDDDKYKLPKDVLVWRWKLAKARHGTVPYAANGGLGLYDKFGARLPHFDLTAGKITRKDRRNTPVICLRPAAGIYLVREEGYPISLGGGRIGDLDLRRLCLHPLSIKPTKHGFITSHELARARPQRRPRDIEAMHWIICRPGHRTPHTITTPTSGEDLAHVQERTHVP
jgi:hypothetical protein